MFEETNENSQLDCSQLSPDEERDSPDTEGTSRRLERPKSSGERKICAEKGKKFRQRLLEAAADRRSIVASPRPRLEAWRARRIEYKEEARAPETGLAV